MVKRLTFQAVVAFDIKNESHYTCGTVLLTGIHDMKDLGLDVDLKSVETNMVYFNVNHRTVSANELVKRMLDVTDSAPLETRVAVRILTAGKDRIRLVLHHQVCQDDVHKTLGKIKYILTSSQV